MNKLITEIGYIRVVAEDAKSSDSVCRGLRFVGIFSKFRYRFGKLLGALRSNCSFKVASLAMLGLSISQLGAKDIQFNRDVRPILSDKCFSCHGPSEDRKAKLRLDTFEGATDATRPGGAAILPGKPEESLVVDRIYDTDPDEIMPPPESHKVLSEGEKSILAEWIRGGAQYQ